MNQFSNCWHAWHNRHYWYAGLDAFTTRVLTPGTARFLALKLAADTFILGPVYVVRVGGWHQVWRVGESPAAAL